MTHSIPISKAYDLSVEEISTILAALAVYQDLLEKGALPDDPIYEAIATCDARHGLMDAGRIGALSDYLAGSQD